MRQTLSVPKSLANVLTRDLPEDAPTLTDLIVYVGSAHRCALAKGVGKLPSLSIGEVKVLRQHAGIDAGNALRQSIASLETIASGMRLTSVAMDQHAVTVGKLPTLTDDGRKLSVTAPKDAANRDALMVQRQEQAFAQHARNLITVLTGLSVLWRDCLAAGIAVRAMTLPGAKAKGGKRMESHLAAVALSDPGTMAAALKAKGLDDAAIGTFMALLAKVGLASAPTVAAPAALPAPTV